jgi:hypothetical protein
LHAVHNGGGIGGAPVSLLADCHRREQLGEEGGQRVETTRIWDRAAATVDIAMAELA